MKYYYDEDNLLVFRFKARLHERVILYNGNFENHIKDKHPCMSIKLIEDILDDPDYIYKGSKSSSCNYYEKKVDNQGYRVVIGRYDRHIKVVITAYKVNFEDKFTAKHVHCIYDKETFWNYEEKQKELEDDIEYFYEIFNIE